MTKQYNINGNTLQNEQLDWLINPDEYMCNQMILIAIYKNFLTDQVVVFFFG